MEFFRWRLDYAPESPNQSSLYRLFPGGWKQALAEAHGPFDLTAEI